MLIFFLSFFLFLSFLKPLKKNLMNQREQAIVAIIRAKLIAIEKKAKNHPNQVVKMKMSNELIKVLVREQKMVNLIQKRVT